MKTVKQFFKRFSQASNCTIALVDVSERNKEIPLFRFEIKGEEYGGYENYKVNLITIRDNKLILYIEEK